METVPYEADRMGKRHFLLLNRNGGNVFIKLDPELKSWTWAKVVFLLLICFN